MTQTVPSQHFQRGVRACIAWLHSRALIMNDHHAAAVLNSAAFDLGGYGRPTYYGVKLPPTDPTGSADSQSQEPAGPTFGAKTPSPPLADGEPETP